MSSTAATCGESAAEAEADQSDAALDLDHAAQVAEGVRKITDRGVPVDPLGSEDRLVQHIRAVLVEVMIIEPPVDPGRADHVAQRREVPAAILIAADAEDLVDQNQPRAGLAEAATDGSVSARRPSRW